MARFEGGCGRLRVRSTGTAIHCRALQISGRVGWRPSSGDSHGWECLRVHSGILACVSTTALRWVFHRMGRPSTTARQTVLIGQWSDSSRGVTLAA